MHGTVLEDVLEAGVDELKRELLKFFCQQIQQLEALDTSLPKPVVHVPWCGYSKDTQDNVTI